MLMLTPAAGELLTQIIIDSETPPGTAVRFVMEEQGIGMNVDHSQDGDTKFEHEGRLVLLLDAPTAELLAEHTLDVEDGEEGPGLALLGPDESSG